jgi:hypothetical protein
MLIIYNLFQTLKKIEIILHKSNVQNKMGKKLNAKKIEIFLKIFYSIINSILYKFPFFFSSPFSYSSLIQI